MIATLMITIMAMMIIRSITFTYKKYPEIHWVHIAWFIHDKQFDVKQQYRLLLSKVYWFLHKLHIPDIVAKSQP